MFMFYFFWATEENARLFLASFLFFSAYLFSGASSMPFRHADGYFGYFSKEVLCSRYFYRQL
jgi:hypothetical protein